MNDMLSRNAAIKGATMSMRARLRRELVVHFAVALCAGASSISAVAAEAPAPATPGTEATRRAWEKIAPAFVVPPQFTNDFGNYTSPLRFADGRVAKTPGEWQKRREEILQSWHRVLGSWPELLREPAIEILGTTNREGYVEHRVRVPVSATQTNIGCLLVPNGTGRFPAVVIPFYDAETSVGRGKPLLDFGLQLTRRGFVTLSIGSPPADARNPELSGANCQPLSFLGYVAANCHSALARLKEVDPARIGIIGHSYGGKWALFASCLDDRFACAAWSDPGIVFDETRANVNYWEPWYLGREATRKRSPGIPSPQNPRTGSYQELVAGGNDLHELHALMAPRPFLVSGGSEDPPERWRALNHTIAVNALLGKTNRVAMTNRKSHSPTPESNEQLCAFFEYFLGAARVGDQSSGR